MQIIYHHRTQGKGAEGVHINETVNALIENGHKVKVVSLLKGNVANNNNVNVNVNVNDKNDVFNSIKFALVLFLKYISKHTPETVFEFLEVFYNVISFPYLVVNIIKYKPVFIYERYSLFMFSGVLAAKLFRIPIILEVNDSAIVPRVRQLHFKKMAKFFEGRIFSKCSGLIFISNEFLKIAEAGYPSGIAKSLVSPNAANVNFFNPNKFNSAELRIKFNLVDKVVCGYVGAFHKWHGIDWFVKLLAPMLGDSNLVLFLIGDGPCLEEIENYVKKYKLENKIILSGRVDHEKVPELLSLMDFSILPDSNMYGSPMKIFEFMAMGVSVVAPNYPPIKEVIKDNETGWLFDYENRMDAVNRTLEIASNIDTCRKVGVNAREYILSQRTWRENANDITKLYEKIK